MTVSKSIDYLLEDCLGTLFVQPFSFLYILQQIAAARILHNHQKVLLAFKNFQKPNHARVSNLLQYVHLLENLPSTVIVLDVRFVNRLDSDFFAS